MDEAEEDEVELVVAGSDPTEALEPAEEALDLVAAAIKGAVVGLGRVAAIGRRDDGAIAQLPNGLADLVIVIGAVDD